MRASVSLTSFFSSLRSPVASSHRLIPIIQIVTPTDPAPSRLSSGFPGGIRRWRGALGTLGDLTLQLPSQGLTSGARLALARQGCATGSFRLNCAESLYVRDSRGHAMFQRIELDEELDKARLGLRERPPMLAAVGANFATPTNKAFSTGGDTADHRPARRPSLRTQKRNLLATQSMRFASGGLSSCATFTAGLCNLEDYIRAGEADSAPAEMPTICSAQEISQLSVPSGTPNLSWLHSLRRLGFSNANNSSGVKKRRSAGELVKSFSCIDFNASFSEADLTLTTDMLSPDFKDSSHTTKSQCQSPTIQLEADSKPENSSNKLHREGSWTRLRRKISGKISVKQLEFSDELRTLDGSVSVASGLFQILEHGMPVTCVQPCVQPMIAHV